MDSERWKKIEALYNSAIELPLSERAAFVSQNSSDKTIELEVLSLLASAESEDSFLEEGQVALGFSVLASEDEDLLGETVGRYRILRLLGRGGMGQVYLAQDTRLNRKLALKLLPRTIVENRGQIIRFEHEARAASSISHPNVAHIYEIAEADGRHFITMEYVEGPTVRELLNAGQVAVARTINIGSQVATALIAAHKAAVIHRDIKPENIVVTNDGYVKVLDFGLAKLVESIRQEDESQLELESLHTQPELLLGTSHYMSPEQIRRGPIDSRADLWSLGVVLHEMLLGCRPFDGNSFSEVIASILEKNLGANQTGINLLPSQLKAVLLKLLSKDPKDRYQTAHEVLLALQQCAKELPDQNPPTESPPSGESEQTKNGRTTVLTDANPRPVTLAEKIDTRQDEQTGSRKFDSLTPKLRTLLWAVPFVLIIGTLILGVRSLRNRDLQHAPLNVRFERMNLAGAVADIVSSPDGRYIAYVAGEGSNQTIHVMELATRSDLTVTPVSAEGYSGLSFSPDGTFLYYLENHAQLGSLYRVSKLGGGLRKILEDVNTAVTFSPDGSEMAFVRNNKNSTEPSELWKAKADGSEAKIFVKRSLSDGSFFFTDTRGPGPVWSPNGKWLACAAHNGKSPRETYIELVDVVNGTSRKLNNRTLADIGRMAWLSDNTGVLVTAQEKTTAPWQIYSLSQTDDSIRKISSDANNYRIISGARDSSVFVTLNVESNSSLWRLAGSDRTLAAASQITARQGVLDVRPGVDGQKLLTINDGTQNNIWTLDANGVAKQITFEGSNSRPVITMNGRYIVYSSNRAGKRNLWRIDSDGLNSLRLTAGTYEDFPFITPDDNWVVYRTGGEIRKVSINGGEPTRLFEKIGTYCALSADGRFLAIFASEGTQQPVWYLDVHDIANGQRVKRFDLPSGIEPFKSVAWNPDHSGITYVRTTDGAANIWLQPNSAEPPRQLTSFKEGEITSFSWSANGEEIYCVRSTKAYVALLARFFEEKD